jgi:3-oxoacyl-[acyl-carrier protein] reductase
LEEELMAQDKRTALITGSNKNIGRAIALHLAEAGHNIVVNGSRDRAACEEVAAKVRALGADAMIAICDIGDRKAVQSMAKTAIEKFGRVDILVNNAAVRPDGAYLDISEDEWQRVMDTNFYSVYQLTRACLPGMIAKGWGRIVNFTGMMAQQGYPGKSAAVSVSKHAVWGLTKSLSREFGPKGITANIISPGTFPGSDADPASPRFEALRKANPAGRLGVPDDIAAMVDLLVSDRGGFINGQMLQVNGGVVNQF